jgi:hypothetical protein
MAMQKVIAVVLLYFIAASPILAQKTNTVTCTGQLIDLSLRPRASLAVIYDTEGGYACVVARKSLLVHDPVRACSKGDHCRLVGTYSRKNDTTYVIDRINSIDAVGK